MMSELTIERELGEERFDEKDDAPGYIQPKFLKELWFRTGTVCNLRRDQILEIIG